MKKTFFSLLIVSSFLFSADFQLEQICDGAGNLNGTELEIAKKFPIGDCKALSKSRGGNLDAIDAIKDGAGTVVISPLGQRKSTVIAKQNNTLYELAKNHGEPAKKINKSLIEYVQDDLSKALTKVDFGESEDLNTPPSQITRLSCQEILNNGESTGNGIYEIDPDGDGGLDAFNVYCDMNTDGGGWTLLGTFNKNDSGQAYQSYTQYSDTIVTSPNDPGTSGLYKGDLSAFSEAREQISCTASGCVNAYTAENTSDTQLSKIRTAWGWGHGFDYSDLPSCKTDYNSNQYITGCSRWSGSKSTTTIGWAIDANTYGNGHTGGHCWVSRGDVGFTAKGSALCQGEPNATRWALLWFR